MAIYYNNTSIAAKTLNDMATAMTSTSDKITIDTSGTSMIISMWDKTVEQKNDKLFGEYQIVYNKTNIEGIEYYDDAVAYKNGFFHELKRARKHHRLSTPEKQQTFMSGYDWKRMTAQDEAVWRVITAHLES